MSVRSQPRYVVEPMEVSGCSNIFETLFFSSTESRRFKALNHVLELFPYSVRNLRAFNARTPLNTLVH